MDKTYWWPRSAHLRRSFRSIKTVLLTQQIAQRWSYPVLGRSFTENPACILRKLIFSVRCVSMWNSLPAEATSAPDLTSLKGHLVKYTTDKLFTFVWNGTRLFHIHIQGLVLSRRRTISATCCMSNFVDCLDWTGASYRLMDPWIPWNGRISLISGDYRPSLALQAISIIFYYILHIWAPDEPLKVNCWAS